MNIDTSAEPLRIHSTFPRYQEHAPEVPVWNVTPGLEGCFHRFFDTTPISPSGRYVAVLRMPDEFRLNRPGEQADVVLVDLWTGERKVVAQTRGWEPQMGANLNWGADDHSLIFNDVDPQTWTPQLVRFDPLRGRGEKTPGGVYHVSPDGRFAAAASMESMRRTQIGYGVVLPDEKVPMNLGPRDDDGLFITDLQTGERKLVLPLSEAVAVLPDLAEDDPGQWHIFGFHTKWSPDGSRLIFTIRRWRRDNPKATPWNNIANGVLRFDVLTCRPDGSELHNAVPASRWVHHGHHIHWYPDSRRLSMNLGGFGEGLRLVKVNFDGSGLEPILADVLGSGHPSVHPSGHILTDTYTHEKFGGRDDGTVPLRWIDMQSGAERELVRVCAHVEPKTHQALRVDAHPAWDRGWRWVAFNGVQNNTRQVFLADLAEA